MPGRSLVLRILLPVTVLAGLLASQAALAAPAVKPTVPAGYTITKLADAPKGTLNCDDLAFLDSHLFIGCQNNTTSSGGGGNSTLVEYGLDGKVINTWSIKDKIDGLGANPLTHLVIITLNEDARSHLETLNPSAPTGQQFTNYTYSPDIRGASTPPNLHTGGGTDTVTVDSAGDLFIVGSHASTPTGTAVFKVKLTPPSTPTGTGTAALSPTFLDNATATNGTGSGTTKLSLGDADSATIVPQDSPRFGGSFVITDQTALQLVFASNIFNATGLTVLKTAFGLDDIRWTTSAGGTLYVVNNGGTTAGASAIYKATGPFAKNTVLASNDGLPDEVAIVNLNNGSLTPFIRHLTTAKGLIYLNSDGTQTALPLAGATPVSSTSTKTTTMAPKSKSSSNAALIVIIIVVVLLALGGGFAMMRRRGAAS
jgi:hypothetical protein